MEYSGDYGFEDFLAKGGATFATAPSFYFFVSIIFEFAVLFKRKGAVIDSILSVRECVF